MINKSHLPTLIKQGNFTNIDKIEPIYFLCKQELLQPTSDSKIMHEKHLAIAINYT